MFALIIRERSGDESAEYFEEQEIQIGRVPGNELVLRAGNVSRQHARLVYREGRLVVSDLGSANGTYVNGRRIRQATILRDGDELWIGDYCLRVELGVQPPRPPEPQTETQWYVYREDSEMVGPVTSTQVVAGIRAGKVPVDSYVCQLGTEKWQPIDYIQEFSEAVTESKASASREVAPIPTELPPQLNTGPETLWYVIEDGSQPFGPISTEQLRRAIRSGQIPATAQANQAGTPDWYDLAILPEFYDEVMRLRR